MLTRPDVTRAAVGALVLALAGLSQSAAQDGDMQKTTALAVGAPMESLWLQDVRTPLAVGAAEGVALCQAVHAALRQGVLPETPIGSWAGSDTPRALFLSWSDGTVAARTCVGVGATAADALANACRKALECSPSPRQLTWLKLDLVQQGEAVINFSPRDSRLPLPSLIGLSFGPAAGFDFVPEQLVAWDLVDPQCQISVHYVSERVIGQEYSRYLPETERRRALARWTTIIGFTGGQKACLFETQSFFHDGQRGLPLFRGHALYENVAVDELRRAAVAAGDRLVQMGADSGHFESTLPEWELGKAKGTEARDYAVAVLALVRLSQATGEARYLKTAERAARVLVAAIHPYGGAPQAGCLTETEELAAPTGVVAKARITSTRTNALAVAALCELSEAVRTEAYHPPLALLAQHLILQMQPDGSVIDSREFPALTLRPPAEVSAAGSVLLAFSGLYGAVAREVFLTHAKTVAGALRKTALATTEMESLPRDVWLMEGLDRYFTFTREATLCEAVERLGLAALLDQSREVAFADGYGAVAGQLSVLPAADRSRLVAVGARLLHAMGRTEGTDVLLGEARPFVLFQMQTQITPPDAMYLADPRAYLGLFRDHVLDFGFELRGQAAQILSLLAVAGEMERLGRNNLPEDLAVQKSLAVARAQVSHWPRYLTAAMSAAAAQPGPGQPIEFRNATSATMTIRPASEKGGKDSRRRKTPQLVPIQPKR